MRRLELAKWREMAINVEWRLNEQRAMGRNSTTSENAKTSPAITSGSNDEVPDNNIVVTTDANTSGQTDKTVTARQPTSTEPSQYRSSPRNLSKEFMAMTNEIDAAIVVDITSPGVASTASSSNASNASIAGFRNSTVYLSCQSNGSATPVSHGDGIEPTTPTSPRPRLVRSNSYTLEHPSDVFIKHMEEQGIDVCSELSELSSLLSTQRDDTTMVTSMIESDTDKSTLSRAASATALSSSDKSRQLVRSRPATTDQVTPKSLRKHDPPVKAASFPIPTANGIDHKPKTPILSKPKATAKKTESREDILRRIYGGAEPRTARAKQRPVQLPVSPQVISVITTRPAAMGKKPKTPPAVPSSPVLTATPTPKKPSKTNLNEYNRLLQLIEERHSQQMNELLLRQQSEQQRLQLEFTQQQAILSQQISQMMLNGGQRMAYGDRSGDSCAHICKHGHSFVETMGDDSSSVCECDDTGSECM